MLKRRLRKLIESVQTETSWQKIDRAIAAIANDIDAVEWLCRSVTLEQRQLLDQDGPLADSLPGW